MLLPTASASGGHKDCAGAARARIATGFCREFKRMLRGFFRLASLLAMAIALVAGVLDLTRSIADKAVVMTPFLADWQRLSPATLDATRESVSQYLHPWFWSPVATTILSAPTWALLAGLAIGFGALSSRRRRRWQENYGA
jgi:hypothetical protein